ncbi:MAG: hypothetical protein V2A70_09675 [Candidatus Omnitrophota bacterium]
MKVINRIVLLFAIVFFLTAGNTFGADKAVLKGIKAVDVYVGGKELNATQKSQLQTDVELKLRLAGIKVDLDASQWLVVDISINEITGGDSKKVVLKYAHAEVYLSEWVLLLSRNQETSILAKTWNRGFLMHGPPDDLWPYCRDRVRDLTDTFINDYLSVNQK